MSARITGAFRVEECGAYRGGRACVRLLEPLVYFVGQADSAEIVTVPAGFETDFASIPFGLWNLFPPLGPWARPAIVHDFLYATRGTGMWDGGKYITAHGYSREQSDAIFYEAMEVVGVPTWRRSLMFAAVRAGGWKGWGT